MATEIELKLQLSPKTAKALPGHPLLAEISSQKIRLLNTYFDTPALGLHAKRIVWDDGKPATIVIAQDVTEQKRTQDKIAAYVKQLEGAMRGTLQAVSNMVEIRDPYTAGHERRVGLIASAIAKEMGWDEERCSQLEL